MADLVLRGRSFASFYTGDSLDQGCLFAALKIPDAFEMFDPVLASRQHPRAALQVSHELAPHERLTACVRAAAANLAATWHMRATLPRIEAAIWAHLVDHKGGWWLLSVLVPEAQAAMLSDGEPYDRLQFMVELPGTVPRQTRCCGPVDLQPRKTTIGPEAWLDADLAGCAGAAMAAFEQCVLDWQHHADPSYTRNRLRLLMAVLDALLRVLWPRHPHLAPDVLRVRILGDVCVIGGDWIWREVFQHRPLEDQAEVARFLRHAQADLEIEGL